MQVEEMLPQFPIKEFHPFPRGLLGPGAHEIIGPEALKLGFKKTLVMTSGLRGSDIVHKISESLKYHQGEAQSRFLLVMGGFRGVAAGRGW
jgi:methanol:N,N-dimethyl-4-nitrosoaniline oxidoreductase